MQLLEHDCFSASSPTEIGKPVVREQYQQAVSTGKKLLTSGFRGSSGLKVEGLRNEVEGLHLTAHILHVEDAHSIPQSAPAAVAGQAQVGEADAQLRQGHEAAQLQQLLQEIPLPERTHVHVAWQVVEGDGTAPDLTPLKIGAAYISRCSVDLCPFYI